MSRRTRSLEERFWPKVDRSGPGCWPWTAACFSNGYGLLGGKPVHLAHRLAWALTNGPIPQGLQVLHHCDNRRCCRPDHLFLGTAHDNMADMCCKGRAFHQRDPERHREVVRRSGSMAGKMGKGRPKPVRDNTSNYAQKLDEATVATILHQRFVEGWRGCELAQAYGIGPEMVSAILCRKSWKHVPMPQTIVYPMRKRPQQVKALFAP